MHDPIGDQMKALERASAGTPIPAEHPVYARIDGRGFSRFTRGMERPFDARMTSAMTATAAHLLEETHALAAYVQSDEISLAWNPSENGEHFFGGKPLKMASVLAGLATAAFTRAILADKDGLASFADRLPHFDARIVEMPEDEQVVQAFAWRGQDARRNAISMVAQANFSHRQLQGKSTRAMTEMLREIGVTAEQFPAASRHGTLLRRVLVERTLTEEERLRIPQAHRPAPDLLVKRHQTVAYSDEHPGAIQNLREVLFGSAEPAAREPAAA